MKKIIFGHQSISLSLLGFLFFSYACYPGFMSIDSFDQYAQSKSLRFGDGHPPVMAWVWSKLNIIFDGPQGLLFLHLSMLWVGLCVWSRNFGVDRNAIWFVWLGFLPWIANFEGVLWKDMGMAYALLLAVGLMIKSKLTMVEIVLVIFLLLYAFMVRSNAPAALLPIIWFACLKFFPSASNYLRNVITALLLITSFLILNMFNYSFLNADKNHMATYMMIDDLVHLSKNKNKSLLPRIDDETLIECSEEVIGGTKLVGRLFCLTTKPSYQLVAPIPYGEIKEAWFDAISQQPYEYLIFRFKAYLYLLRDPFEKPYIHTFFEVSKNDIGLSQVDNMATRILKTYVNGFAKITPFLFKPYWWLIVSLLLYCATFAMRGNRDIVVLIRVLLSSAILYMLSYVPLTPMADLRYVYWSMLAISLAIVSYASSNLWIDARLIREKLSVFKALK